MSTPGEDLLSTNEGVDEGSAASTAEGGPPAAGGGPADGGLLDGGSADGGAAGGATDPELGPVDVEASPAPPDELELGATPAGGQTGTGQQLAAGEG